MVEIGNRHYNCGSEVDPIARVRLRGAYKSYLIKWAST
jgi:hypothetical protein